MKKSRLLATAVLALSAVGLLAACGNGGNASQGGGDASSAAAATYTLTVKVPEGCSLSGLPEGNKAEEGQRITFKVVTEGNQVVESVTYNGTELKATSSGQYRFVMPGENVTIEVKLVSVTDIKIDTSGVKTAFFVGGTFNSDGLKVTAVLADKEEEVSKGFTVSTPDLTTAGTKTVTVSYGGFSKTYDIKVGSLQGDDADVNVVDGKVIFSVLGSYEGFANAAELTAAASKGAYLMDFQYNNNIGGMGWDRPVEQDNIVFEDAGNGRFKANMDITELAGAGAPGIGYTFHFGLPQVDGSDAGHASDLKLTQTTEHDNKSVTVGSKTYTLSLNVGVGDDGMHYWGCIGMTIVDVESNFVTPQHIKLVTDETTIKVVIEGQYRGYTASEEDAEQFYVDCMQFSSWATVDSTPVVTIDNPDASTHIGNYRVSIDITGKLNTDNDYFFHVGPLKGSDRSNLTWMDDADAMTAVDPSNGGVVSLFKITGNSEGWKNGLASLNFLGGDYVIGQEVDLIEDQGKAIFQLKGIYSGISNKQAENDPYYLDCMDFATNTDISNEGADTVLEVVPENVGATKGVFTLSLDVTGKLTANQDYYFHFGALAEGATYRSNLRAQAGLEPKSVLGGQYTLKAASGYTDSSETWRNGLAIVTFTAAE